ncbi:MAG: DNA-binding transcriptional regulator [Pseudomonadales bacterium]|nr:DNA-binding transcriptional regulator [Pseudomonadales bacterium]NRA18307.1 DNA-binding transcriptional regulator [Oceanospirillaceae bacterium]
MFSKRYSIRLLFNANKVYDRQVVAGIGEYLQSAQCDWDIFLEEDFHSAKDNLADLGCDGIIADYDDPLIQQALHNSTIPVVAVGSSYRDQSFYPNIPYVATDNDALVECAYQHLKKSGLRQFAFYGLPDEDTCRYSLERERAYRDLVLKDGFTAHVYRGKNTAHSTWSQSMAQLKAWLKSLPQPIGIIAVTDSRARHLLQCCEHLGIFVPDQTAVIGIDNEKMARYLNRVSLSSVGQGTHQMGYRAAHSLHQMLQGQASEAKQFVIGPTGVFSRQSSDFKSLQDPNVIQAMHYIRQNACRGIKVEQVVDYVGISRSNLEKRFLEEHGYSIHHELHQTKFNRAKDLLRTTTLASSEIATLCGYPSLQYLYTVFNKNLQQTPREYRLQQANQDAETTEEG